MSTDWRVSFRQNGAGAVMLTQRPVLKWRKATVSACRKRREARRPYRLSPTMGVSNPSGCEGIEGHAGLTVAARQDLKTRDGSFAVCRAHHLPWTVVRVGAEGKTDKAFVVRYRAVEQSYVSFFDVPRFKQLLQLSVRFRVFGDEEHSRGVHVQTVHQERSRGLGKMRMRPAPYGKGVALAGYGKHAGRFIDSSHPFVFVDEFRLMLEVLAVFMCVGFHIQTL